MTTYEPDFGRKRAHKIVGADGETIRLFEWNMDTEAQDEFYREIIERKLTGCKLMVKVRDEWILLTEHNN